MDERDYKAMNRELNVPFKQGSDGWVPTWHLLPEHLKTVWITNGKGWVALGCVVKSDEGYHWAESNGVIYAENGEIVSECESEDLDVAFWHPLPKLPNP